MLKITHHATEGRGSRLAVEGRLGCDARAELVASAGPALARGVPVVLDLGGVTFADAEGAAALSELAARGAELVGASPFLAGLLDGEAPLVARLRAGDDDAYAELVRRHTGRLLAVARRILGNEEDARDAVQEGFIAAFGALDGFAGGCRLSTWLHRIVVNAALMKLRRRRRKPEQSIEDLLPTFLDDGHWAEAPRRIEAADETLARAELRAAVRAAIASLPDSYRAVLVLRDLEDLDTEETAEALGITPGAVRVRLHRARQALTALLEPRDATGR